MRTFFEFTQGLKEEPVGTNIGTNGAENPTLPVGQEVTPPTPSAPPGGNTTSPDEAAVLEKLTNDVQRAIDRLFKTLDKHRMNKQKAMGMLSTIIANVSNQYGLNATNVRQAGQQGLRTNAEPISPPMQPQANG
jgi:hypothetical protein